MHQIPVMQIMYMKIFVIQCRTSINCLPSQSQVILMGDFNTKVIKWAHEDWSDAVRKFGLGYFMNVVLAC